MIFMIILGTFIVNLEEKLKVNILSLNEDSIEFDLIGILL